MKCESILKDEKTMLEATSRGVRLLYKLLVVQVRFERDIKYFFRFYTGFLRMPPSKWCIRNLASIVWFPGIGNIGTGSHPQHARRGILANLK